jgi:hypothetical protein
MGRPIKLSDRLAEAAAEVSRIADRSIPAQIEHWANLGRAVERTLTGHAVELIKAAEGDPAALTTEEGRKANLLEGLRHALTPEGRQVALATISVRGPRYGADPDDPSMLVRISPDGRRVRGRLIDSDFIPEQFLPPRDAAERDTVSDVRTGAKGPIKHKVKSSTVTLRSKKGAPRKRARG